MHIYGTHKRCGQEVTSIGGMSQGKCAYIRRGRNNISYREMVRIRNTCIHVYTHTHTRARTRTHTCIHERTHTDTHTHTHTHTHTCTHAPYSVFSLLFRAAPAGPPQHVAVTATTKREITVRWSPPFEYHQNGFIDQYQIRLIGKGGNLLVLVSSSSLKYSFSNLSPGYFYTIEVCGHNSDGFGPYSSPVSIVTTGKSN